MPQDEPENTVVVPCAPSGKPEKLTAPAPKAKGPVAPGAQGTVTAWNEESGSQRSSAVAGGGFAGTGDRGSINTGRHSALPSRRSQEGSKEKHTHRKSQLRYTIQHTHWYHSKTATRIRNLLHGKAWGLCMTVLLLVALFLPDIWVLAGSSTNAAIDIILFFVMILFGIELVFLSAVDATYFLSFFFIMDIVGTITMIFDISFMFGSDNSKVLQYTGDGGSKNNMMLLRATRAARVGARAGRLSRVLKMLRFLPFLKGAHSKQERGGIAGSISGQLANLLATRVACLTILLVVVIPLFDILTFPQSDYSLTVWTERLARAYSDPTRDVLSREAKLRSLLEQMNSFFARYYYGPYLACRGHKVGDRFVCLHEYTGWSPKKDAPPRPASAWEVTTADFMVAFNMHGPSRTEAAFAIVTIIFIMILMIFSGLVLSSVVTELAVRPLERMLQTVKDIAQTVFNFGGGNPEEQEEEEVYDIDSSSEMKLLEKVVQKLAIIADLQSGHDLEATEDMQEEDIGILNMMQGKNVIEEKVKQGRRSVAVGAVRRKNFMPAVKYEDFGMTQEVYQSWSYNTLNLTKPQKINLAMFDISRFHEPGVGYVNSELEVATLQKFVNEVEKNYLANPFHNFAHATDVLHAVARMMRIIQSEGFLVELEQYSLLVAACAHDLGHPGVNNGFLSEVGHELALQYNDRSPLENMHCAKLYQIVNLPACNIFSNFSKEQYREVRKYCIETILHTDMMGHNAMVKELQMVYQMNAEIFAASGDQVSPAAFEVFNQTDTKTLVLNNILHSADVSNPCRTWDCCQPWANMVLEEFFAQGDQEKMLGVPVQFLNDRDKLNRPNSQIGFLEFMIVPFFAAQIRLWTKLADLGSNLSNNIQHWQDMWVEETKPAEEEKKKVQARINRVVEVLEEAAGRIDVKK